MPTGSFGGGVLGVSTLMSHKSNMERDQFKEAWSFKKMHWQSQWHPMHYSSARIGRGFVRHSARRGGRLR